MVDLNATQAAIRAGYSPKTAGAIGEKLLKKAEISADIERRKTAQLERVEVRADEVLAELKRLGLSDLRDAFDSNGHLLDVKSLPDDIAHSIAGIEVEELFEGHGEDREHIGRVKKIKLWDKNKALESLGRHLQLFIDRVKVDVDVVEAEGAGIAALAAKALGKRGTGGGSGGVE